MRSVSIENEHIRLTVLIDGGHISGILHKASGIDPLWKPRWQYVAPTDYRPDVHKHLGTGPEAKLLGGIMGHNVCIDIFGPPSDTEAAAGIPVHGEASVNKYEVTKHADWLVERTVLDGSAIEFERRIHLRGTCIQIGETVTNQAPLDRPIAWTQHVSMGAPFVEHGITRFVTDVSQTQKMDDEVSANLVNSGYFAAERDGVRFGYRWNKDDFPWLTIWQENRGRKHSPWNGEEVTCGMEFGVSPFPETRRQMIERGTMFGVPTYRWLPARGTLTVSYDVFFEEN